MSKTPALTVLSDDETLLKNSVYEFADKEIRPLSREMDEHAKMPRSLVDQLFEQGFMGIEIPESHGGTGMSFFDAVLVVESLSRVDPSVGVLVDVQNTLVINAVMRWGSEALRHRYLPRLAARSVGAYCLSEAGSGSDAFALTTRAVEEGDSYRITGRKLWITNGNEADVFIVFATVNPEAGYRGITAFMVDRDTPGFTVGKKEDKLGIRASSTCELLFEDCLVPKTQILGEVKQFGKAIGDFQNTQFKLADMATQLEACRLMVLRGAWAIDTNYPEKTKWCAMAKRMTTDACFQIADDALQLHGGYGYLKDYPLERIVRDLRVHRILEGTNEIMRVITARELGRQ